MRVSKVTLRICLVAAVILAVCYAAGPIIAAVFRYPDRRGPRIYPRGYHEVLFVVTHEVLYNEKPRVPFGRDRAWFYGTEQQETK